MPKIAWIALGGAAGTCCRYYVATWMLQTVPAYPFGGTLTVNLIGSFLLGLLFAIGTSSDLIGPTTMLALTTGFMGGFTTYSTFSLDTFKLLRGGSTAVGVGYVSITVLGSLLGTAAGFALGGWLYGSPAPTTR